MNVHKAFRRRPGGPLNVLCTFSLRPVSTRMRRSITLHSENLIFCDMFEIIGLRIIGQERRT